MTIQNVTDKYFEENRREVYDDYVRMSRLMGVKNPVSVSFAETPPWTSNVKEEYEKKDHVCASALLAMSILNGPTDIEEIKSAAEQIVEMFGGKKAKDYDHKTAQHPFSFFRGTILKDYINPYSDQCINKKFARKIIDADKSLFKTKLGQWVKRKLGVEADGGLNTSIHDITYTEADPRFVKAIVLKSPNEFADLTARALLRTTKFGTMTLGGLGAIHAAYRINEGNDPKKELAKAALEVATTIAAVGYLGAAGAKYGRTLGSITGTALGVAIGASTRNYADKLFNE